MEIYFSKRDDIKAVRSVLTLGQFKKYVTKQENLPGGGFFLRGEIPGITVEKKTYPDFIFSVPIPESIVPAYIREKIILIDLYEIYLKKVAWDDKN